VNAMLRKAGILLIVAALAAGSGSLLAEGLSSALRGAAPLDEEGPAAPMTPMRNTAERETRNYPEQPPVIPHSIEGYQIDINGNKCLSCHARARTGESQAPMVSITHFMDRDGQFLASISPRRFFCTSCHVPQNVVTPPVTNDFIAMFKDSSIVSVITMVELTKVYGMLAMSTYDYIGLGLMTAAIYFALSYPASLFANYLERKWSYDRR